MDQPRETGVISSFFPERKFGFIRENTESEEIFFNVGSSFRPDKIGRQQFYAEVGAAVSFIRAVRHIKTDRGLVIGCTACDILPAYSPDIDAATHREESIVSTLENNCGFCYGFLERSHGDTLYFVVPKSLKKQLVVGVRVSHGVVRRDNGKFWATNLEIIVEIWPPSDVRRY
jgi:cold shock CspA family protein